MTIKRALASSLYPCYAREAIIKLYVFSLALSLTSGMATFFSFQNVANCHASTKKRRFETTINSKRNNKLQLGVLFSVCFWNNRKLL